MKILIIVLVCFVALGMVVVGAGYYAVHRVKEAVVSKANSYGVDLHSIPSPSSSSGASSHKVYKPCEILPKSEASSLLGQPIERTDMVEGACTYYGPPGLAAKLATQGTAHREARVGIHPI
jgi:hypothetical protein